MFLKYSRRTIKIIGRVLNIIRRKDENLSSDIDVNVCDLSFTVNQNDNGGAQYLNKVIYEEINDPLYFEINKVFNPSLVIDVGANYGITGVNFAKKFPNSYVILVEPDKRLCKYIASNFNQNGFVNYSIIQAVCGEQSTNEHSFFLNPNSSQDNRVIAPNSTWIKCVVESVTLDDIILNSTHDLRFVFIKIDTQGYESYVLNGVEKFITSYSNWIIKMEFAPYWLIAHNTDPASLLKSIVSRFQVVELPSRTKFKGDGLQNLFQNKLEANEINDFLDYIQSLNTNNMGWCDLLILPRDLECTNILS